jgi:hypothetical protein
MRSKSRYRFGAKCVQCKTELIAPEWSAYSDKAEIRHRWRCCRCDHCFETTADVGCSKVV